MVALRTMAGVVVASSSATAFSVPGSIHNALFLRRPTARSSGNTPRIDGGGGRFGG
jgi:hypothetical protein